MAANTGMSFGTNGGAGIGAPQTPYIRAVNPETLALMVDLEQRDMLRLRKYSENFRFFLGQHWQFERDNGEPLVTINLIKLIINKGVAWLAGNGWSPSLPESLVDYLGPMLVEPWEVTDEDQTGAIKTQEMAQMGGVTGDVWVLVTHRAGRIVIKVLPSESVFPLWDPQDVTQVRGYKIVTLYYDEDHATPSAHSGPPNMRRHEQILTKDVIIERLDGVETRRDPNPLGVIPVVHIRNMLIAGEYFGESDIDGGVIDLQRELNEKSTDFSDIVNYHAQPVTVIVGAKVGDLERGPKRVWSGFPQGTQIFNLDTISDLPALDRYIDRIQTWLHQVTELPASLIDGSMGVNTSGTAIGSSYQPLVDKMKRKKPLYEMGISEVCGLVLRWREHLEGVQMPENFCASCGGKIVNEALRARDGSVRKSSRGAVMTKPRCFWADPWTNDFMTQEEIEAAVGPAEDDDGDEDEEVLPAEDVELAVKRLGVDGQPVLDASGVPVVTVTRLELTPTGCKHPKRFDPYKVPVKLNPPLPRDEHQDANLSVTLIDAGVWSRKKAMRRMRVSDPHKMMREIRAEKEVYSEPEQGSGQPGQKPAINTAEQRDLERGGANFKGPHEPSPTSPGRPRKEDET